MKNNQRGVGAVLIIVIIAAVLAVGAGAYFVFNRSKDVATNAVETVANNAEKQKAFDDCKQVYADEDLCRALSNFMNNKQFQVSMSSMDASGMTFSIDFDSDKTYSKQTFGDKTLETIIDGNTTYTKDPTDGKWWKQVSETSVTSIADDLKFDFTSTEETSKTTYTKIGEEPCGNLTCIKYQVIEKESTDKQFIWIDTKDHLVRKWASESSDGTKTEATYTYDKKSVDIPTNTKDAAAGQSVIPADFYSGMTE